MAAALGRRLRGLLRAGSTRTKTAHGARGLRLRLVIILRSTSTLRALRWRPALAICRIHGDCRWVLCSSRDEELEATAGGAEWDSMRRILRGSARGEHMLLRTELDEAWRGDREVRWSSRADVWTQLAQVVAGSCAAAWSESDGRQTVVKGARWTCAKRQLTGCGGRLL